MSRRYFFFLSAAIGCALLLCSCGGSGERAASGAGRLALTVVWPERSRLIPLASNSIVADLTGGAGSLASRLLERPENGTQTSVVFERVPVGSVTLTATAKPNADGSGVAQATGSVSASITAGQTTRVTVTMASTIDHVVVAPQNPRLGVGASQQLTLTAFDAQDAVVLVSPQTVTWSSGTPANVGVSASGMATGVQVGASVVTATETESGKSATTTVTVEAPAAFSVPSPTYSTFDPLHRFFYVVSNGNAVYQFAVNPNGTLSPLNPASVSAPAGTYHIQAANINERSYLYATVPESNQIAQWQIGGALDGVLTPLAPATVASTGDQPLTLAVHPSGAFVYTADSTHASGKAHLSQYAVNPSNGTLSVLAPDLLHGFQVHWIAITPDGGTVFTDDNVNDGLQAIQIFTVAANGTLSLKGEAGGHFFSNWLSIDGAGKFLYALFQAVGVNKIQPFAIGANSTLAQVGDGTSVPGAVNAVVSPDGRFVYAADQGASRVLQFRTNPDGSLTALDPPSVATDAGPIFIAVSASSAHVYVSNRTGGSVSVYAVGAGGHLTRIQ